MNLIYPKFSTDEEKIRILLDFTEDPYERRKLLTDLYGTRIASLMISYANEKPEREWPDKGIAYE